MSDLQKSDPVRPRFERIVRQIELEDRRVATPFILEQAARLEDLIEPKDAHTTPDPADQGIHDAHEGTATAGPAKATSKAHDWESPPTGIHSLTQSVSDEVSSPISEVDDSLSDRSDDSSRRWSRGSTIRSPHEDEDGASQRSELDDEVAEGYGQCRPRSEVDDEVAGGDGHPRQRPSSDMSVSNSPLQEAPRESREDREVSQPSQQLGESDISEAKADGSRYPRSSDSDLESSRPISESGKTTTSSAPEADAVSYLEQMAAAALEEDEAADQSRLDSEMSVFYPQQLDPDEVINPFTLEDRIRKAREDQDFLLQWEQEASAGAMLDASGINDPDSLNSEHMSGSTPEVVEIYAGEATDSSGRASDGPALLSEVKERRRRTDSPNVISADEKLLKRETGAGEAVVLGVFASGVNEPTWFAIRGVLAALVVSLVLLLHVAIQSASWLVLLHVVFLIAIATGLIILLSWYISETGLVSVEKQMEELNLNMEEHDLVSKTL